MNELQLKRVSIEKWAKFLWLPIIVIVVGYFASKFIMAAIGGIVGIVIALILGLAAVNFIPSIANWFANKRLQALKYTVSLNPVEQMERKSKAAHEDLEVKRAQIEKAHVINQGLATKIQEHKEKFPDKPSKNEVMFQKLLKKVDTLSKLYKKARKQVQSYDAYIEEKRSDWEIAKALLEGNKVVDAGAKFEADLLADEAARVIQQNLDAALADIDSNLLDDEEPTETTQVTVSDAKAPLQISAKSLTLPTLDLDGDDDVIEAELVKVKA